MPEAPAKTPVIAPPLARTKARTGMAVGSNRAVSTRVSTVSLVIPCYNEADGLNSLRSSLIPLMESLRRDGRIVELVLVDDGSRDDTFSLLQDLFPSTPEVSVKIVRHVKNQGLSSALRTAAGVVTGDIVCTMDADCTYPPNEILGLLDTMERTSADVVTGSPYHPEGGVENVQGWRLALSRGASRMYAAIVREKLYCYTSMFRAYRREWYRAEFITTEQFIGVTELLVRAIRSGARVAEYPVVLRRRVYGVSKLRVGQATWAHLKFMGHILVHPNSRTNGAS